MRDIDCTATRVYPGSRGPDAPVIYVIDSPDHPFDLGLATRQRHVATVVTVPVARWNDTLTPWPAAGLYRGEPAFGGDAAATLAALVDEALPAIEAGAGLSPATRALCGYSLGGLFALYALTHSSAFTACACLSGSVWYEGWVEHLRELDLDLSGRFAYLSLGTKERRAARPLLKTVQDRMEACAAILRERGCQVTYRTGPGNHLQHVPERLDAGLAALDGYLARSQ
jgi:predicted alpha/beta superfamily hydrolase